MDAELLALQAVLDLSGKDTRVTLKVEQIAAARRDKLQPSKVRLLFASPPLSDTLKTLWCSIQTNSIHGFLIAAEQAAMEEPEVRQSQLSQQRICSHWSF